MPPHADRPSWCHIVAIDQHYVFVGLECNGNTAGEIGHLQNLSGRWHNARLRRIPIVRWPSQLLTIPGTGEPA